MNCVQVISSAGKSFRNKLGFRKLITQCMSGNLALEHPESNFKTSGYYTMKNSRKYPFLDAGKSLWRQENQIALDLIESYKVMPSLKLQWPQFFPSTDPKIREINSSALMIIGQHSAHFLGQIFSISNKPETHWWYILGFKDRLPFFLSDWSNRQKIRSLHKSALATYNNFKSTLSSSGFDNVIVIDLVIRVWRKGSPHPVELQIKRRFSTKSVCLPLT